MADQDKKTVTLTMPQEQYAAMERLAQKQGISMRDYLLQAFELSRLVVTATGQGQKVLFKDGNSYQELKLAS